LRTSGFDVVSAVDAVDDVDDVDDVDWYCYVLHWSTR
jgi:hypothetical protein